MILETAPNENSFIAIDRLRNACLKSFFLKKNCNKYKNDKINNNNATFPFSKKKDISLTEYETDFIKAFEVYLSIIEISLKDKVINLKYVK